VFLLWEITGDDRDLSGLVAVPCGLVCSCPIGELFCHSCAGHSLELALTEAAGINFACPFGGRAVLDAWSLRPKSYCGRAYSMAVPSYNATTLVTLSLSLMVLHIDPMMRLPG
jgi:hypothetical protein